jgi:hypothetical protein
VNCDDLHRHLDAHLEGTLDAALARELAQHLGACEECRTVVSMLAEHASSPVSYVREVVARTTGSTCGRVREALADGIDAVVEPGGDLHAHLEECIGCREVAAVLVSNASCLSRLAESAVDADFTADVLMLTLTRPSLVRVFGLRVREHVAHWLDRPLAAQELAFACTVFLVLLTATPWSPWPGLPQRMLDLLQFVPEVQASETESEQENWSLVQALPPLRYAAEAGQDIRGAVTPRVERMARDLDWVSAGLEVTGYGVVSGETGEVREGLRTLGCGLSSFWEGLRVPQAPVDEDCAPTSPLRRGEGSKGAEGVQR